MTTPSDDTDKPSEKKSGDVDMFGRKRLKRFYKTVSVEKTDNGYTVTLDGRSIKTPGKNLLEIEHERVAIDLAKEWDDQSEFINMDTMHLTKVVNTAIDRIAPDPENVIQEMIDYTNSDLLCYRALEPESLVQCQSQAWDPVLDWLEETYDCRLHRIGGIMHKAQPEASLENIGTLLRSRDALMLAVLHNMTTLTGSCCLSIAVSDGFVSYHEAWEHTHVDEDWQIEQWGKDEDAIAHRQRRWLEMEKTGKLMLLLRK